MSNDGYIWPSELLPPGNAGQNMDDASDSPGLDQDSSDHYGDPASSASSQSSAPGLDCVEDFNPSDLWEATSDTPLSDVRHSEQTPIRDTAQYLQRLTDLQQEIGQIIRERQTNHQAFMERQSAEQTTQPHGMPHYPFLTSTGGHVWCYPFCAPRDQYELDHPPLAFAECEPCYANRCPFYFDPRYFCIFVCDRCFDVWSTNDHYRWHRNWPCDPMDDVRVDGSDVGSQSMPIVDAGSPIRHIATFDSQPGVERPTTDPMAYLLDPPATGPSPPRTLVGSSESAYSEPDSSMYLVMNSTVSDPGNEYVEFGDDLTLMFTYTDGGIVPIQPPDWPPLVDEWEEYEVEYEEDTLEEFGIRFAVEFLQRPKTSHHWVLVCSCTQSLIRNCREIDASEAPRLDEAYQDADDFILWCIMHIPRLRHDKHLGTFYFIVVIAIIHVAQYTGHDTDRLLEALRSLLTAHDRVPPTDEEVIEAYWGGIYVIHQLCWNERLMQSKRFSGAPESFHIEIDRLNWATRARSLFEEHPDGIPAYQILNGRSEERLAFPVLIHHLLGGDTRFQYEEICKALLIWHNRPWQHLFWQPPTYHQFVDAGWPSEH
ncbi:hypothetical protein B0T10DRAFT_610479 [Thelonectria olida]|uniref:Uncharacterized protein n=1 Tax=Thelonectria olida TaxID=1576542 RepID=A0A9P9AIU3_9HYPO|nr:hypothetical protein B0T10DRAFT_610479 [Thelonectria olida]